MTVFYVFARQRHLCVGYAARSCMEYTFRGFGFRVSGFGFRDSDFEIRVSGFEIRVPGFELLVSSCWFRVSGFGFRVSSFVFGVWGLGLRVAGGWEPGRKCATSCRRGSRPSRSSTLNHKPGPDPRDDLRPQPRDATSLSLFSLGSDAIYCCKAVQPSNVMRAVRQ